MLLAIVITLLTACALIVLIAIALRVFWPVAIPPVVGIAGEQPVAFHALIPSRAPPRIA